MHCSLWPDLAEIAWLQQRLLLDIHVLQPEFGMAKDTVDLLNLDDEALSTLYAARIEPILKTGESNRLIAMRTYVVRRNVGIAASAAVGAAAYFIGGDALNAMIFAGFAFAAAHWYAYRPLKEVASATKAQSLTAVAGAIGCTFDLGAFEPEAFPRFTEMQLVPGCDRTGFQDCFRGGFRGCDFVFYEGHLERRVQSRRGSRWQTVFRGQLIRIAFPKTFHGVTVVRRDAGIFNVLQRWTTKLQRVGLSDSRLEKAFEVYSNDQVEARYLIHPVFMERLLGLEAQFKGKRLRCAFEGGDLLIAVEGGDKFELGSMFARLDDIERARIIVKDVTEIMRVIDAVLTAERAALPNP
jgi:hypothetical protein